MKRPCGRWGWIERRRENEFCLRRFFAGLKLARLERGLSLRSGGCLGLGYRHLEDFDVVAERLELQVVKVSRVAAQVLGKIRFPSCLKNEDGVPWLEAIGVDQVTPEGDEHGRGEVSCGSKTGGDHVLAARKRFEIRSRGFERNGLLMAQVMTEDKVALVVGEDESGRVVMLL